MARGSIFKLSSVCQHPTPSRSRVCVKTARDTEPIKWMQQQREELSHHPAPSSSHDRTFAPVRLVACCPYSQPYAFSCHMYAVSKLRCLMFDVWYFYVCGDCTTSTVSPPFRPPATGTIHTLIVWQLLPAQTYHFISANPSDIGWN